MGRITASFNASLADSNPAMSSHRTFGFSDKIADERAFCIFFVSASSASSPFPELSFEGLSMSRKGQPCDPLFSDGLFNSSALFKYSSTFFLNCSFNFSPFSSKSINMQINTTVYFDYLHLMAHKKCSIALS